MKKFFLLIIIFVASLNQYCFSQDLSLYKKFELAQNENRIPYRILLPENFNPSQKYPLIIFLHGSGERGNDNEKQLVHGAKLFLQKENRQKYPAIVVFPQCPEKTFWSNAQFLYDEKGERNFYYLNGGEPSIAMKMLVGLVNNLFVQYKIKKEQVYVMGLSMGGMGTFELVNRMPHTFAAAIPICGGANPEIATQVKNTSWWIFHGAKDNAVPPEQSEIMYKALKKNNVPVKFTLYPEAGHNSWDNTFNEPGLLKWIFSKKLKYNTNEHNN